MSRVVQTLILSSFILSKSVSVHRASPATSYLGLSQRCTITTDYLKLIQVTSEKAIQKKKMVFPTDFSNEDIFASVCRQSVISVGLEMIRSSKIQSIQNNQTLSFILGTPKLYLSDLHPAYLFLENVKKNYYLVWQPPLYLLKN